MVVAAIPDFNPMHCRFHASELHKAHSGHVVLVSLTPHCLTLWFNSSNAIKNSHGTIQDPKRSFHLQGEIHVARCVDNVDSVFIPEGRGGRTGDGDASLLFLLHPIHGGLSLMHLSDFLFAARVVQDALSRGGLARIDVSHDANVSVLLPGTTVPSGKCL